jgi:D-glycero-D-manno-heptose 1,7-bisphosphate phosphatase
VKHKVVFLDRDGVINEIRHDDSGGLLNYVNSWEDFVWLPGSKDAIIRLLKNGYFVCVVSNQAGVGKGYMSLDMANSIMEYMELDINKALLKPKGEFLTSEPLCIGVPAEINVYEQLTNALKAELNLSRLHSFQWLICPHTPEDKCSCRKPQPGMIYAAAFQHELSLKEAWMVGDVGPPTAGKEDQLSDLKAGWMAGIRKLVRIGEGESQRAEWKRNRLDGKPFPNLARAVEFMLEWDGER